MSLHLRNISSFVRKDELEHVFWKFGHCNVNLKYGYGFVVYDVPVHAENAMRVLRGKQICGEPISLSWSKQQPKSSYSVSRINRSFELQRGRKFKITNEYFDKKLDFKGRRDYKYNFKQQGSNGGNTNFENVDDTVTKLDEDNSKETAREDRGKLIEDYSKEECKIQKDQMNNNRWETGIDVPSSKINDESGFHRSGPFVDVDDKNVVDEYLSERYSGSSPTWRRSQDKTEREFREGARENLDILSPHKGFCICGEPEHKMHSCSRGKGSVRKRLCKFDDMPDKDFREDMNGLGTRSQERLKFTTDVLMRRPKIENRFSSSIKQPRLMRSVDSRAQEIYRGGHRTGHVERKRTRRENGNPDKRDAKKFTYCDRNVSRSFSESNSSRSVSKSDSYSRSLSRNTHSGNNKFRARSSSPASSSLSVSLDQSLPSSPDKTQMNQDDKLDEQIQVNFGLHNLNCEEKKTEIISTGESLEEKDNAQEDHILQDGINVSSIKNSSELGDDDITLSGFNTKSVQEDYSRSISTNPLRISSEELGIVLKHYGLNVPTEDEKDLPVDAYFGSARLWPWQIIYYRRLKKGSISTGNYARRVVQNQEFGIVDKYIRSSSGWGELGEENSEL